MASSSSSDPCSTLTKILGGTAFQWESEKSHAFDEWWQTTSWAGKLRENLAQKTRSNNINSPRWDSKLRGAPHWVHFGQGAKVHDGEPFLYCLCCKATLRHPRSFNVGTTHMKTHLSSDKCVSASGRNREDISSMFEKVRNYGGLPQRIDQVTNTDRLKNLPLHQWPNLARTSFTGNSGKR